MKISKYLKIPLLLIIIPYLLICLYFIDSITISCTGLFFPTIGFLIALPFGIISLITLTMTKKKIDFSYLKNETFYRWIGILAFVNCILELILLTFLAFMWSIT